MQLIRNVTGGFSRWIDCVAAAIVGLRARLMPARNVHLVEGADGTFTILPAEGDAAQPERLRIVDGQILESSGPGLEQRLRSSRVELVLQSVRFVFRPLELPRRASEFLDGIVRAQIDRLTPWPPEEAAFGYSTPREIPGDRILLTVAATARASIAPFVQALASLSADTLVVSTLVPDAGSAAAAIKVFEQKGPGGLQVQRVRRTLIGILAAAGLLAATAVAADIVVGDGLQARQDDVVNKIAARRATMRASLDARDSVVAGLEQRKYQTPSSVIVLEALSRIFPDHTYVTELRIVGDKVQVVGITRDAPALIRLIEQSTYFTRATFFAPTTRSPSQSGDNFHIEAQIQPIYAPPT
jgi:general secretion pathway protein L